jgi:UDP-glucose 4-epimerase
MKILVTGGAGFIGSHIVDRLVIDGYRVRVVDNMSSGRLENLKHWLDSKSVELLVGDLREPEVALRAVDGANVVFHFAANPEVRLSTTEPEVHFTNNIVATFNVLEAIRRKGVEEIVFASSSTVYGEPETIPVGEDAPLKPISVYGASKAACENIIHSYTKLYGIKAVVLRYANIVGPRLKHGVVWDFINKLLVDRRRLEILGDGRQVRSYMHVEDAVEATMIAWRKSKGDFELYNIASEDWITVDDVADIVVEVMGLKDVEKVYRPMLHGIGWPGDVKRVALRIDRLRMLGFKPKMRSREAVARTVAGLLREISKES